MKVNAKTLASCLAAAVLAVCALASCNNSSSNDDDIAYTPSGDSGTSSGSVVYTGAITAGGTSYTSLSLNGNGSSGTAVLAGTSGSVTGSYARPAVSAAANTLTLSGTYTLTFGFGSITVTFGDASASLSAGSVAASGSIQKLPEAGSKGLVVGKYYVAHLGTVAYESDSIIDTYAGIEVPRPAAGATPPYEYTRIYKNYLYFKITEDGKAEVYAWKPTDAAYEYQNYRITYAVDGNTIHFESLGLDENGNPTMDGSGTQHYSATKTDDSSSFTIKGLNCYYGTLLSTFNLITFEVQDSAPTAGGIIEITVK